jgi:phosphoribosylanthranilate isomerase
MKVKICGLKNESNVHELMSLNPDYLGFIFYEKSLRFVGNITISLQQNGLKTEMPPKLKWIQSLSPLIPKVGVFVNSSLFFIEKTAELLALDVVQMHGDEKPAYCEALKNKGLEVWKAFQVDDEFDFDKTEPYADVCDHFLFDAKGENPGGNGLTFNWQRLESYHGRSPFILSGGIGPEHGAIFREKQHLEQLKSYGCFCLDLNSRFELEPGLKDVNLLKNFMNELSD